MATADASEDLGDGSDRQRSSIIVAAIDFGTTFSGYALSFIAEPTKIYMNRNWAEGLGFQSHKAPTCVLTDSDGQFVAFGYEAETKYAEMGEEKSDVNYHLYRHFKMMLHNTGKLTREATIKSVDGRETKAMSIFTMSLRHIKQHLLDLVSKQMTSNVDESLVKWVLTVPAIWREEAKKFMREAAYNAGMIDTVDSRQLVIALEPECASIHCRSMYADYEETKPEFPMGSKYLLIDAGGGTVDITVHEVLLDGKVREIHPASGGPWGGKEVDENFIQLLSKIFGEKFIKVLQSQHPWMWMKFMVYFEKVKRAFQPDGVYKIKMELPYQMACTYEDMFETKITNAISNKSTPGVSIRAGSIVIEHDTALSLFQPVIDQILSHVQNLVKAVHGMDYILLVGGFGECSLLQKVLKNTFQPEIKVIVPMETQLSVIKGAVEFGHRPDNISTRKSRKSYGVQANEEFNPSIHDENYKFTDEDGIERCSHLFDTFVLKGSDVEYENDVANIYTPAYHQQTTMSIVIYSSDNEKPVYIDEPNTVKLAELEVAMPNVEKDMDRDVYVQMFFGGTEILVRARDMESMQDVQTVIDFLSE